MTRNNTCPFSSSCFDCPLPDCKAPIGKVYNPLPNETRQPAHRAKRRRSSKRRLYTEDEKALIWEHRELTSRQISELLIAAGYKHRSDAAVKSIRAKMRRAHERSL